MEVIPNYSKRERYFAGRTDLEIWLRSRGEELKKSGSEWEWDYQGERVTIRNHIWFDQYTQTGGDAVKFLQYFYNYTEEDAVAAFLGYPSSDRSPQRSSQRERWASKPAPPKEKPPLIVPAAHSDMRRVFAYLCRTRGVDPQVVSHFARTHLLYEDAEHHNAVFIGRDEQGRIQHIHKRSTGTGSHFRQTLPGSLKQYSFHHVGSSDTLFVSEAPIDMLSYISLHPKNWQEHSYVALCGVGMEPITHFLETYPQLKEVILCLDNDEAGHKAAQRIAKLLLAEWVVTVSAHFPDEKDWNDELLSANQAAKIVQQPAM